MIYSRIPFPSFPPFFSVCIYFDFYERFHCASLLAMSRFSWLFVQLCFLFCVF